MTYKGKYTRPKSKVLADCVASGAMTEYEKQKFEKAIYDKRNKGKSYNFELISQIYHSALELELKPTKKIQDKQGNVHEVSNLGNERKNLLYLREIMIMEKPYINNPESLKNAIEAYMSISLKYDAPLSVNGLAIALGVNRQTLKNWHEGRTRVANKDIIDQAFAMIDTETELAIRQGKGNVVGQIFLAKNDSGYVDEQKVSIKEDKIDDLTEEDIAKKYADIIDAK